MNLLNAELCIGKINLAIAAFSVVTDLTDQKLFKPFVLLYNAALPFMVIMLFVRGIY